MALKDGFQYLEQRDSSDNITKAGVVNKKTAFCTCDNRGILDVIAENFRWLKDDAVPIGHIQQQYVIETGYLKLDGSTVSRTTYADLWSWVQANSLTTVFGVGDGSTTFVLPNITASSTGLIPQIKY